MTTGESRDRQTSELEFELPGSAQQVWQAVATGPGISAWFVPTEVEERQGGRIAFHLGPETDSAGHVTVWEPPHRFCYEEQDWAGNAPPLTTELIIRPRTDDRSSLRLVHSVVAGDAAWEKQLDGMKKGWPPFFEVLRVYLREFAGQPAASFRFISSHLAADASVERRLWHAFLTHFNLESANTGQRLTLNPQGAPQLTGVVRATELPLAGNHALVRLEGSHPGVILLSSGLWGDQAHVTCGLYLYGPDVKATLNAAQPAWEAWLKTFDFAESEPPLSVGI